MTSEYQAEQLAALSIIRKYLDNLSENDRTALLNRISAYLQYRREVAEFLLIKRNSGFSSQLVS